MSVVLASNSPRRKELLKYIFNEFTVAPSNVDETIPKGVLPENSAQYVATQKAMAVAKKYPHSLVIGCDTVVLYGSLVLGKPSSVEDCFNTLKSLSDCTHKVITGVCLVYDGNVKAFSETTEVTFNALSDEDIRKYISTGEPFDKAGGYGIQGYGSLLVKEIHGDYFNVVGLPVSKLNQVLKTFYPLD
jgi:septum formation protein